MAPEREVCIVTDSTSDIPRDVADALGITIVPLSVTIGGHTFVDDGSMTMEEFFRRMDAEKVLPTTSQPPVGEFVKAFEGALTHCKDVVCVSISSKLSGTMDSALEAARSVGSRVHVFDSLTLSYAEGLQALAAAKAAAAGAKVGEVLHLLEDVRERVELVVGLDTLENLAKGGRIGRVSAFLGGMLNIKVLLTVAPDGAFEPVTRARGTIAAMQAGVDWLASKIDVKKRAVIGVLHAASRDKAEWLENAVRARFNVAELVVIETGPVIGTHTSTGWGLTGYELD
jgi:DegV family protein with EDD domain